MKHISLFFSFLFLLSSTASGKFPLEHSEQGSKAEVRFNFDSAALISSINSNKDRTSERIQINGYTDTVGESQYNKKLSTRRAQSVARHLRNNGSLLDNFDVRGHGEDSFKLNPQANRRVEIIVPLSQIPSEVLSSKSDTANSVNASPVGFVETKPKVASDHDVSHKNQIDIEVNALFSDLASIKTKGDIALNSEVDEVLSEVKSSIRINYARHLNKKLSLGVEAGVRWYAHSKDLGIDILSDQELFAYRAGLTLGYKPASWFHLQLSALWNQQLYFEARAVGTQDWQFKAANTLRGELKPLFIPVNTDKFMLELGPWASYFAGVSAENIKKGLGYGGELNTFFLFGKRLGLTARYSVNEFPYTQSEIEDEWDLTQEILEIGIKYRYFF